MIASTRYPSLIARDLDQMARIGADPGADPANRKPSPPGANSPDAAPNHRPGAVASWSGEVAAGHPAHRDRASEFTAAGPVGPPPQRAVDGGAVDRRRAGADPRALPQVTAPIPGPNGRFDVGAAPLRPSTDPVQRHGRTRITRDALVTDHGKRHD
jgi:hypothetical protein